MDREKDSKKKLWRAGEGDERQRGRREGAEEMRRSRSRREKANGV